MMMGRTSHYDWTKILNPEFVVLFDSRILHARVGKNHFTHTRVFRSNTLPEIHRGLLAVSGKVEILLFYSNALPLSRLAYCKKDNCQTALLPRSGTATKIFSWSCSSPNAKTVTVWGVDSAGPTTCLTQADNTWS